MSKIGVIANEDDWILLDNEQVDDFLKQVNEIKKTKIIEQREKLNTLKQERFDKVKANKEALIKARKDSKIELEPTEVKTE